MGRAGASVVRVSTAATLAMLALVGCSSNSNANSPPETSTVAERAPAVLVETRVETETEPIPYEQVQQDDPNLDLGTTTVTTAGVPGVRTLTFSVTVKDGRVTGRELIRETVTTAPVNEVTSIGSRVAPPAPVPLVDTGAGSCDPNYSGACVPIASDVDCANGSGNGPAYVQGPVWVVGSDVYDLDRDGDGVACD